MMANSVEALHATTELFAGRLGDPLDVLNLADYRPRSKQISRCWWIRAGRDENGGMRAYYNLFVGLWFGLAMLLSAG
jgi:hypothetical protein